MAIKIQETKTCQACGGSGKNFLGNWNGYECHPCNGKGFVPTGPPYSAVRPQPGKLTTSERILDALADDLGFSDMQYLITEWLDNHYPRECLRDPPTEKGPAFVLALHKALDQLKE